MSERDVENRNDVLSEMYHALSPVQQTYVQIAIRRTTEACKRQKVIQSSADKLELLADSVEMAMMIPAGELEAEIASLEGNEIENPGPKWDYWQYTAPNEWVS